MRDLTPVRLSGAGALLVLADGSGVEYAVRVTSLRTTLEQGLMQQRETAGRAGATQAPTATAPPPRGKEPTMESSLRPRDIQSRIRAGESPEEVAAVAGTSVEKVMIFASPVLAERAHVAQSAESASVRRAVADPTSVAVATTRTLGAAVAVRLREVGVDPASVDWDSWRREDGRWTLEAGYDHAGRARAARFSFDQRGHFVAADDDEARWLIGDGQVPARAADAAPTEHAAEPVPPVGLRLAPAYAETEPAPAAPVAPSPRRYGPAPTTAAELGEDTLDLFTADADWMATVSQPDHTPDVHPEPVVDPAAPVAEPTPQETGEDVDAEPTAPDDATDPTNARDEVPRTLLPPPPARTTPRAGAKKGRGRASVPSWDEIMFGGGK